ncbi:DNA-directed RNA polymerase III subunit RPC25 [Sporobolomyces salmoneus]|uniref:DNA-directed RNA polymerase III subunit RPC25 n=1 Tax=Sporobolomyces salmoneus TaxID=183962 RepID=UPI00316FB45E
MFTYCIQKDTIRVEPRDFAKPPAEAIKEEIHRRYSNKVIPGVGLCISLLDILSCTEGAVLYGDGCFYYQTEFRLIMFRPYIGEAILGKVKSQGSEGIIVTLGFFDDILIPPTLLPDQCGFDGNLREYFWVPLDPESNNTKLSQQELHQIPTDQRLPISKRDWIRIRVEEELFDDTSPTSGAPASGLANGAPAGAGGDATGKEVGGAAKGKSPYRLLCSMTEEGTGCIEWWAEAEPMAED